MNRRATKPQAQTMPMMVQTTLVHAASSPYGALCSCAVYMPLDSSGCLAASLPWPFESSAIAVRPSPDAVPRSPDLSAKGNVWLGPAVPEDSMMCLFRFYD